MTRALRVLALALLLATAAHAQTLLTSEALSVTTTSTAFTTTKIAPTGTTLVATQAVCVVSTAAVNYQVDGTTTVTSATTGGTPAQIGSTIYVNGPVAVKQFRAISQSATTAVLACTYSRP